jgi:hypothetical protein
VPGVAESGYGGNEVRGKIPKAIKDWQLGTIKNRERRAYETKRLGTFGPASLVRRIDPKTGEIIKSIPRPEVLDERPPWED